MTDIYIVGIGMTPLGKFPDKSVKELTNAAVSTALADAGAAMGDVEAAWFSNTRQGMMEGQNTVRGQCALRSMGFQSIPIVNVENACCSSSTGLNQAYAYLKAGMAEASRWSRAARRCSIPEKRDLMFQAFRGGWDVHTQDETEARSCSRSAKAWNCPPKRLADTGERSVFMDIYASLARQHMKNFGTTQRQIAASAAKSHFHSTMNPLAQYQKDFSVDDVLNDRLISWPLTRAMCAPLSDGAGALVLARADAARPLRQVPRRERSWAPRSVSGSDRDPNDFDHHLGMVAADRAYDMAGVSPEDVDVAEVHDASAYAEIVQVENMGFCAPGRRRRAGRKRRDPARRAHSRSTPPAACCPRVIPSARPARCRSKNSSPSCVAKPANVRSRARGSQPRKTAAVSSASRKRRLS